MSARSIQGRLGAEMRHRPDRDHTDLKRELKAAQLAEFIGKHLDTWPPLTPEQREAIAALLRPVAGGARHAS